MKIAEMLASKALGTVAAIAVVGGVVWYFKNEIKGAVSGATQAIVNTTNKATTGVKNEYASSGLGQLDSVFSGMKASGANTASSGGVVNTETKKEGIEFNWIDALNPLSSLITSGGYIWNNYLKPTPETGNPTSTGIPLLLARPTVFPKESQEIVDKTLEDSWFTYTGKQ